MLPVGLFMALTLWTGNEVYLYLSVAFIQMLKAFTPVITMMALFIARLEDPSLKVCVYVCRGLRRTWPQGSEICMPPTFQRYISEKMEMSTMALHDFLSESTLDDHVCDARRRRDRYRCIWRDKPLLDRDVLHVLVRDRGGHKTGETGEAIRLVRDGQTEGGGLRPPLCFSPT